MKCAELENTLALHVDGSTSPEAESALAEHLSECPLCRQKKEDYADLRRDLRQLAVPQFPAAVRADLKTALRMEIRRSETGSIRLSRDFSELLQMRVLPLGVGVAASVVIGFGLLTLMFSGHLRRSSDAAFARADSSSMLLASNRPSYSEDDFNLTAAGFASSRAAFAQESPSINPEGALVALTKSLMRGQMKDEEVVVVADVFSDGLARINEVVESPKDRDVIRELEKALANNDSSSPFVPTVLESRPEHMQIILKLHSVNVRTGLRPVRRRS